MPRKRNLRFLLTILIVRLFRFGMRVMGHNATHFPGTVALKLCPSFLGRMGRPRQVIAVTGTNGKTTVANLIADLLRIQRVTTVHNSMGSNIKEGVITALLEATTLLGRARDVTAVLEIDERASRIIFPELKPDLLVVTNLFSESYLRNGHAEFIYRLLDEAIPADLPLIVNADDLLSSQLARSRPAVSFGIEPYVCETEEEVNRIQDVVLCPDCGSRLIYDFRRYHHIGRAHCPHCGFTNPPINYCLTRVLTSDGEKKLVLRHDGDEELYPFIGNGRLDLYNELTGIACLRELGYDMTSIGRGLARVVLGESRQEKQVEAGVTIRRMLAKGLNPVAVTRVIEMTRGLPGKKAYVLLNDTSLAEDRDVENTAWIYDADFERLVDPDIVQVVVGGWRACDYGVRLLFAGVDPERVALVEDKRKTVEALDLDGLDEIIILYELYSDRISREIARGVKERLKRHGR